MYNTITLLVCCFVSLPLLIYNWVLPWFSNRKVLILNQKSRPLIRLSRFCLWLMWLNWEPRIPRGASHASKLRNWLLCYYMQLFSSHLQVSFSQGNITTVLSVLSYRKHLAILYVTSWYSLEGKARQVLLSLPTTPFQRSTLNQEMKSYSCSLGGESRGGGLGNRLKGCLQTNWFIWSCTSGFLVSPFCGY